MDCRTFQSLINDFLFDQIEYSDDLEDFLSHAKECTKCDEELTLYYSLRRSMGDISAPDDSKDSIDLNDELNRIKDFYGDVFEKQRARKKAKRALYGIVAAMGILVLVLIALNFAGIIH